MWKKAVKRTACDRIGEHPLTSGGKEGKKAEESRMTGEGKHMTDKEKPDDRRKKLPPD
jgi:hypothetical protein